MKNTTSLFFELIRVAIGNMERLFLSPSADEWCAIYDMARKQSLVGVCFAGVQRTLSASTSSAQVHSPFRSHSTGSGQASSGQVPGGNLPDALHLQWMGMTAKIQQNNEMMNHQCAKLQARLSDLGLESCILKGQAVASLYDVNLRKLRQSGDIDIWVCQDRDHVYEVLEHNGIKIRQKSYVEAYADYFDDTVVEIHSRPSMFYSPWYDKVFSQYVREKAPSAFNNLDSGLGFSFPDVSFNLVFILIHIYRHVFQEGVGLRQLLDYYFVLINSSKSERDEAFCVLQSLGLTKFAAAIMHLEISIFGLDHNYLLVEPDEAEGKFIAEIIMKGGNFGYYDNKIKNLQVRIDGQMGCTPCVILPGW